jgi:hypothetical protein
VIVPPLLDGGFVALGAGCLLTALGFGVYLRRYGGQDAAVTRRTRTG